MAKPTLRTSWTGGVLTLLVSLLLMVGCYAPKRTSASASAPADYGYQDEGDGYSYGEASNGMDANYGGEMEPMAEMEAVAASDAPSPIATRAAMRSSPARSFADRREAKQKAKNYEAAPPPAEPAPTSESEPIVVDAPELVDQPKPKPDPDEQRATKRQIIYTATMQVSVYDVAHAISVAEALPDQLGGWLHQRVDNQLVLRIPAEQLEAAMDQIAELGVVDQRLLEALDVTAQYTDLDSRIRVLVEMQAQLEALLLQAKDVEQALQIRTALDKITLELELARGQMRELAKSIAFSTLILRFVERGPTVEIPSSNDPFGWVDQLGVETTEYR